MATKKNDHEYDPEKHKDIEKGPLKSEHKNQYGETSDRKDKDLPKRAVTKKGEEGKN
ncbi:MAG: hypothetical protein ABI295_07260 [Xanthomarina sp.]